MNAEDEFPALLRAMYQQAPAQVLPNALWKTLAGLKDCQTATQKDGNGQIRHIEATRAGQLLVHWQQDRQHFALQTAQVNDLSFALIHQDFLPQFPVKHFTQRESYFRLVLRDIPSTALTLQAGFTFRPASAEVEAQAIAHLIGQCYRDIHPSAQTVRGWAGHPVYDPQLWLWVWDEIHQRPAGLGIAEMDATIGEGALEWVQVLPEYQGQGFGQALVLELLARMQGRAAFVTVSGQVDNESNPQGLYRRCGFRGEDIWWVLRKG